MWIFHFVQVIVIVAIPLNVLFGFCVASLFLFWNALYLKCIKILSIKRKQGSTNAIAAQWNILHKKLAKNAKIKISLIIVKIVVLVDNGCVDLCWFQGTFTYPKILGLNWKVFLRIHDLFCFKILCLNLIFFLWMNELLNWNGKKACEFKKDQC